MPVPRKLGVCERLFGQTLSAYGICWVRTSCGLDWKLDLNNPCHRWIVYGQYEGPAEQKWICHHLEEKTGCIVDSGANIGQMLLYFLTTTDAHVYAFEPVPQAAAWIEECLRHNHQTERVTLLRTGLFRQSGEMEFKIAGPGRHVGEWTTINTEWFAGREFNCERLPVTTLDSFMEERKLSHIRLWKLDVEGAEYDALLGAANALNRRIIDAVLIEIDADRAELIFKLFESYSYYPATIRANGTLCHLEIQQVPQGISMAVFTPENHDN